MYLEFRFRRFVQLRQFRFLPPSLTSDFGFDFLDFDGVVFDGSSRALLLWTKAIGSRALAAVFFNTDGLTKGAILTNCACL